MNRDKLADDFLYWGYRVTFLSDSFIQLHGFDQPVYLILTEQGSEIVPQMMDGAIYRGVPLPASPEHTFEWEFSSDLAKEVHDWIRYWR